MMDLVVDGMAVRAERNEGGYPAGRSLLGGPLQPVAPSYEHVFHELSTMAWPRSVLDHTAEWETAFREHQLTACSSFANDEGVPYQFNDLGLLRPPFPTDLIAVPTDPSTGRPPYQGPRPVRLWLNSLTPPPRTETHQFDVNAVRYSRETLESVVTQKLQRQEIHTIKEGCRSATIYLSGGTVRAEVLINPEDRFGNPINSSPLLSYFAPYGCIAEVEVTAWFRKGKNEPRGYGPLDSIGLNLIFSDGWRLCSFRIDIRNRPEPEEEILSNVQSILVAVASHRLATVELSADQAQQLQWIPTHSTVNLPPPRLYQSGSRFLTELRLSFPGAKHFGVSSRSPVLGAAARTEGEAVPSAVSPVPLPPAAAAPAPPPPPPPMSSTRMDTPGPQSQISGTGEHHNSPAPLVRPPAGEMRSASPNSAEPSTRSIGTAHQMFEPNTDTVAEDDDSIGMMLVKLVGILGAQFMFWVAPIALLGGLGVLLLVVGTDTRETPIGTVAEINSVGYVGGALLCFAVAVFLLRGKLADIGAGVRGEGLSPFFLTENVIASVIGLAAAGLGCMALLLAVAA